MDSVDDFTHFGVLDTSQIKRKLFLFRIISNHKRRKLLSQEVKSDIKKQKQTKYEL